MKRFFSAALAVLSILLILVFVSGKEYAGGRDGASGNGPADVSPFTDFHGEAPGNVHHITVADLPAPYATKSAAIFTPPIPQPADAWPKAPAAQPGRRAAPPGPIAALHLLVADDVPVNRMVLRAMLSGAAYSAPVLPGTR